MPGSLIALLVARDERRDRRDLVVGELVALAGIPPRPSRMIPSMSEALSETSSRLGPTLPDVPAFDSVWQPPQVSAKTALPSAAGAAGASSAPRRALSAGFAVLASGLSSATTRGPAKRRTTKKTARDQPTSSSVVSIPRSIGSEVGPPVGVDEPEGAREPDPDQGREHDPAGDREGDAREPLRVHDRDLGGERPVDGAPEQRMEQARACWCPGSRATRGSGRRPAAR